MYSYWETAYHFEDVDFCIVGEGIVGSCTALFLREYYPDAKILILERGSLPKGASTKNAGFACFGSVSEMQDDLQNLSEDELIKLIKLRLSGLDLLKTIADPIKMDFRQWGGYEVFLKNQEHKYFDQLDYYNSLVDKATGLQDTFKLVDEKFDTGLSSKMIFNQYEGQLNPMKMMAQIHKKLITNNISILYNQTVSDYELLFDKVLIRLEKGLKLSSNKILFCTNAFIGKFMPALNVKPGRNQVLVSKPIPGLNLKGTFHLDKGYVYFRNIGNRLLIGGARNLEFETETTEEFGENRAIITHLKNLVAEHILPGSKVEYDYQWSGIIGVGDTKSPIVEKIDDNCYIAVRLGGMGVAIGSMIDKQLAKLVYNNN